MFIDILGVIVEIASEIKKDPNYDSKSTKLNKINVQLSSLRFAYRSIRSAVTSKQQIKILQDLLNHRNHNFPIRGSAEQQIRLIIAALDGTLDKNYWKINEFGRVILIKKNNV